MNNDKLNKLYKIAKIILISLLIINCFKSCSYAFTWNDYMDFCSNVDNSLIQDADTRWMAIKMSKYRSQFETAIQNAGLDFNNYNNFYAFKQRGTNKFYLFMWNTNTSNITIEYNKIVSGVTYQTYIQRNKWIKNN